MSRKRKRSPKDWLTRIDSAKKIYLKWHKDYKDWVHYFRGNQWSTEDAMGVLDAIVVNYVYNTISTMRPTLFFKNPKIHVHGKGVGYAQQAPLIQHIANYDWRLLKIKKEVKRCILRSLIGGLSWIETGYVFQVEEPDLEAEITAALEGGDEKKADIYTELLIKKDQPFTISRSLLDVITDPFANILEERGWDAVKEIAPVELVKRDPRFEGVRGIEPNAIFDDTLKLNVFRDEYKKDSDLQFVEMYHVTDRWEGKTFTIARGHHRKLREFDTPDGYALTPLIFNEDPEQPQPLSVVELIRDQQDEINKFRSYLIEYVKRSLPRILYDKTKCPDEEDVQAVANSEHLELIGVPGDPNQIFKGMNFPSMPAEMFAADSKLKEDIQVNSGLTDFQRGQAVKVPSATEASLIEQSSRLRVDEGLDIVSDFAEEISKNLLKLRQKFTTMDQMVPIVGEDGVEDWISYTRDNIQGEFNLVVEYGSTQKRDQDFMKAQLTQLAPILGQMIASGNPQIYELGRQIMKTFEFPPPVIEKVFPQLQQAPQQPPMGAPGAAPPLPIESILGGQ